MLFRSCDSDNAFTTTVNPTDGIVEDVVEEEELVESKFEKIDD